MNKCFCQEQTSDLAIATSPWESELEKYFKIPVNIALLTLNHTIPNFNDSIEERA